MLNLDEFLNLFPSTPREKAGNGWLVRCPAHRDNDPSLWVRPPDNADFIVKFNCQAGCDRESVLRAMNLSWADVRRNGNGHKPQLQKEIETVYHYTDAHGKPFDVVRFRPKSFAQRQPDGNGGYRWNLAGIEPTVYHQDELASAIAGGKTVFVAEGEKDVDNLRALGLTATCNAMGAGKWRDQYSDALAGATVVIVADKDEPGRKHAQQVTASLTGKAKSVKVLELPGDHVKDASDWIAAGGTKGQLEELASQSPVWKPEQDRALPEIILTGRQLPDKTADVMAAVRKANKPPTVFVRTGHIVRIMRDEQSMPFIEEMSESAFRGFIARAATFVEVGKDGERYPAAAPPLNVVQDCMALPEHNLPPLLGITEVPVMRSDGSILREPGYDEATRLYYTPGGDLHLPDIPDNPSSDELRQAAELVVEIGCNFPWDSDASRANSIAAMLTPVLRPMIPGPTPMCILDKTMPGTGGTLYAEAISIIATNRQAGMMAPPATDEEWEKKLTSLLWRGRSLIIVDNIEGTLYASSLAMVLTAHRVDTRILGSTRNVTIPNRACYIGTGNNVKLAGDLPRRCYFARMEAESTQPWTRDPKMFKHPKLTQWVTENRGRILAAIMTLARSWIVEGKPEAKDAHNLGSFEDWANIIGGILSHAGINGFLGNLTEMYEKSDVDTAQWQAFLSAWQDIFGAEPVTVARVIKAMGLSKAADEPADFAATLPDKVSRDPKKISRSLGNWLSAKQNVKYPNGLMVKLFDKEDHHAKMWLVGSWQTLTPPSEPANSPLTPPPSSDTKGELRELINPPLTREKKEEHQIILPVSAEINSPNSFADTKIGELASLTPRTSDSDLPEVPSTPCECGGNWIFNPDGTVVCQNCRKPAPEARS